MRILVIGWYGTETIGDRAILAGLVQLLTKELGEIDLILGSLYPFFSERTIYEDKNTILKTSYSKVTFSIIDSRQLSELKTALNEVDMVVMGGGPLMDLPELFMVEYAFKLAKKLKKTTAILGCGIGPLFEKKFKKVVLSIVKNSDSVVLRDNSSKSNLIEIFKEFSQEINHFDFLAGFDPAVHYAYRYLNYLNLNESSDYIAINLRSFPAEYGKESKGDIINNKLESLISSVSNKFPNQEILLVPMHYYHIGGDDRYFLNEIRFKSHKENIKVQNKPLTLEQTVETYANATFNIGMRFHSVVLQTISSGKNYILDYTEPNKGKISGFINDIDKSNFYSSRYICLQNQKTDFNFDLSAYCDKFQYNPQAIEHSGDIYQTQIRKLKNLCQRY